MKIKSKTSRIAALLVIAMVNLFRLIASGHLQDMRTVDTLSALVARS
jgi:hypothetical protein